MDFDDLGDQLQGDLNARLHAADGSMLVKFVALAEVISTDGDRSLIAISTRDMQSWESLGMLEFARQLEQASLTHDDGEVE
ncbi:hypothetical protein GCM10023201_40950 [Actinomycetospora corticicola]|uniref:Uncharacterized protein n=1 Tax=Actinomycetospora corticicola TaxID=663602 RepID=A0A7Y9J634_9PSEU|nr:hypothetical protein [Actinomycetospora corticicola]NYD36820.1 hypothetical protein [Actinomycetospora corticicola]